MTRPGHAQWCERGLRVVDGSVGDLRMLLVPLRPRANAVLGPEEARSLRDFLTAWLDEDGDRPTTDLCRVRAAVHEQQRALLARDLTGSDATTEAGWAQHALAEIARAATPETVPTSTTPVPDEGELIMGKNVSLSGALPNSESANGWLGEAMQKELLGKPSRERVAIVIYDVDSIKHKVSTDVDMATVRLRAIEPIEDDEKSKQVRLVMGDIREQRTGERELELEFEHGDDSDDE